MISRHDSTTEADIYRSKSRYESLRETARKLALESLPYVELNKRGQAITRSDISLKGFDLVCERALRQFQQSPNHRITESPNRRVHWDWDEVRKQYRSEPKRFELSIWYRGFTLCGASIGKPTYSGGKLRLDYIEANPEGSPIDGRTTDIIIAAAIFYAQAIGAVQLRIMKPVNDRVKNHYLSKGHFSYNEKGNFCYMDL